MTIERNCGCGITFVCNGKVCKIRCRIQECLCPSCLLNYTKNNPHTHGAIPKALAHCFTDVESESITALSEFYSSLGKVIDE